MWRRQPKPLYKNLKPEIVLDLPPNLHPQKVAAAYREAELARAGYRDDALEQQVRTSPTLNVRSMMRTKEFRWGVEDGKQRKPFREIGPPADKPRSPYNDGTKRTKGWRELAIIRAQWFYERGRLFGVLAPRTPVMIQGKLNEQAVKRYRKHAGFRFLGLRGEIL